MSTQFFMLPDVPVKWWTIQNLNTAAYATAVNEITLFIFPIILLPIVYLQFLEGQFLRLEKMSKKAEGHRKKDQ